MKLCDIHHMGATEFFHVQVRNDAIELLT